MTPEISTQQLTDQQMKPIHAQEMDRDNSWPCDPPEQPADPPEGGGGGGSMPAPSDPHGGDNGGKN